MLILVFLVHILWPIFWIRWNPDTTQFSWVFLTTYWLEGFWHNWNPINLPLWMYKVRRGYKGTRTLNDFNTFTYIRRRKVVDSLWDRTRRALEDAQRNARLVERLEEETKKLKELTDSFNEKRMQDEKGLEEIRLRMEILEREEQEQKEEEKRKKRRLEDDDALAALMLERYGKVKIYTDSGDFYCGTTILHDLLLSQTRRRKLPRRRRRPEQCRHHRPCHLLPRLFRTSVRFRLLSPFWMAPLVRWFPQQDSW